MPVADGLRKAQIEKLEQDLLRAEAKLTPDVVRIRYSLGYDWTGDPAIFFRVMWSDQAVHDAIRDGQLGHVRIRIESAIFEELGLADLDLGHYYNFRTPGEQNNLQDPQWE